MFQKFGIWFLAAAGVLFLLMAAIGVASHYIERRRLKLANLPFEEQHFSTIFTGSKKVIYSISIAFRFAFFIGAILMVFGSIMD